MSGILLLFTLAVVVRLIESSDNVHTICISMLSLCCLLHMKETVSCLSSI